MANEYTSVTTTPGLADNLVKAAYDLSLREELHANPLIRQFVTIRPENVTHQGSSVTINRYNWFSKASIDAAKTALVEEADVDSTKMPATTPVTLTPAERGFAVTRTRLLANRSMVGFDPQVAKAVGLHCARTVDEVAQDAIVAGTTGITPGGVAVNTLTNASKLTAAMLRAERAKFLAQSVPFWEGNLYAAVVHPFVISDLREETGAGGWRVPNEYGISQERIWSGEIGEFEGFRFVSSPLTRVTGTGASSANVFNSYLFGWGGLAEHVVEEPHIEIGPVVDKLNRFRTIGWYADLAFGVFQPKAVKRFQTGSSLGASYVAE